MELTMQERGKLTMV